jgi:hypothetical protein
MREGLLLIAAYLLGAAAGALVLATYQVRAEPWGPPRDARSPERVLQSQTQELGLGPEDRRQVGAILQETGVEFARLREEVLRRFREIRERSRARVAAVLDPGRRAKFEALADE